MNYQARNDLKTFVQIFFWISFLLLIVVSTSVFALESQSTDSLDTLKILEPSSHVQTTTVPVLLKTTSVDFCYYSIAGNSKTLKEQNGLHSDDFEIQDGIYTLEVKCKKGSEILKNEKIILVDSTPPNIVQTTIIQTIQGTQITLTTDEIASCFSGKQEFSTNDKITHTISVKEEEQIVCKDNYGNIASLDSYQTSPIQNAEDMITGNAIDTTSKNFSLSYLIGILVIAGLGVYYFITPGQSTRNVSATPYFERKQQPQSFFQRRTTKKLTNFEKLQQAHQHIDEKEYIPARNIYHEALQEATHQESVNELYYKLLLYQTVQKALQSSDEQDREGLQQNLRLLQEIAQKVPESETSLVSDAKKLYSELTKQANKLAIKEM